MTLLNDTDVSFGGRIRIARSMAGLTQGQLAKALGVARQTIGDWEAGVTEPSASKFVQLAQATNQPLGWFAEGLIPVVRPEGLEPPTF